MAADWSDVTTSTRKHSSYQLWAAMTQAFTMGSLYHSHAHNTLSIGIRCDRDSVREDADVYLNLDVLRCLQPASVLFEARRRGLLEYSVDHD